MNYNLLRKVGAGLIAAPFILTGLGYGVAALLSLLLIAIIDLVLVVKKEDTISNYIHRAISKRGDALILVLSMVFIWWMWGPEAFLPVMLGVLIGHLFWNTNQ